MTPPPPIDDVTTEDKENSSSVGVLGQMKGEKPKKKSAMFANTVEVLSLFVKKKTENIFLKAQGLCST